jgi:Na+/phosphate symporter
MTLQQCNKYRGCLRVNKYHYNCKQSKQAGGCATYRNYMREEHIVNIENNSYNYLTGVYYVDVLSELEKIGDFLINVSQASKLK